MKCLLSREVEDVSMELKADSDWLLAIEQVNALETNKIPDRVWADFPIVDIFS